MARKKTSVALKTDVTLHDVLRAVDAMGLGLNQRFDGVDRRLEVIEQRLDHHDGRFDALDRKVEVLDRKVEVLDQRLESLNKKVDRQYVELKGRDLKQDLRLTRLEQSRSGRR